jgi:hypothetical protein
MRAGKKQANVVGLMNQSKIGQFHLILAQQLGNFSNKDSICSLFV